MKEEYVSFKLDTALFKQIEIRARKEHRSRSEMIRVLWHSSFLHEVYWKEAVQKKHDSTPTSFWTKQPRFQLKKVAVSQGFRLAFPDELGGLPYDASELPNAETIAAPSVPNPTKVSQEASPPVHRAPPEMPPRASTAILAEEALSDPKPVVSNCLPQAQAESDTAPETIQSLQDRLTAFLDSHYTSFTEKHHDWILNTAWKAHDLEGVRKMIRYAEKVVRNGAAVAGATA